MKLLKRDLIFFTMGLVAGVGGGYVYLKSKFDSELQEEVDATRAYYKEKFEKSPGGKKPEDVILKNQKGEVISGDEEVPVGYDDVLAYKNRDRDDDLIEERVNYNKIADYTKTNVIPFGETPEGLKQREGETPPYVISDIEMYNDMLEYDKVTLTYYEGDQTLSDDDEHIIDDVDAIIGLANLESFGVHCEDPDMLHVRNDRLGSDYEVIKTPASYAHIVLNNFKEE